MQSIQTRLNQQSYCALLPPTFPFSPTFPIGLQPATTRYIFEKNSWSALTPSAHRPTIPLPPLHPILNQQIEAKNDSGQDKICCNKTNPPQIGQPSANTQARFSHDPADHLRFDDARQLILQAAVKV